MEPSSSLITGACHLAHEPSRLTFLSPPTISPSSFSDGYLIGRVRVIPFDVFIGGVYVLYVAYYIKKLVYSFGEGSDSVANTVRRVRTMRDRIVQRVIYTAQAISSSMLFFDWGLDKGWFALRFIARGTVKAIAHTMSTIFWSYKCIECIKDLVELPSLIDEAVNARLYERSELEPEIYKQWFDLFSNFAFVLSSGMQVLALITGTIAVAANVEFFVMASLGFMIAGSVAELFFNSSEKMVAVRLMFSKQNSSFTHLK